MDKPELIKILIENGFVKSKLKDIFTFNDINNSISMVENKLYELSAISPIIKNWIIKTCRIHVRKTIINMKK